jgi:uncharacterized protein YjiS (DUF1127 family)
MQLLSSCNSGVLAMRRHIVDVANARERKLSLKALIGCLLHRRYATRSDRRLLELNDHMLRDIGLTRYEVLYGAAFYSDVVAEQKRRVRDVYVIGHAR